MGARIYKDRVLTPAERSKRWASKNRAKIAAYDKKKRLENPERHMAWIRNWVKNNPEKAIERNHRYRERKRRGTSDSVEVWSFIKSVRSCGQLLCFYCSLPVGKGSARRTHIDHVVPLSRGGDHHSSNMVIACPSCNCSKRQRLLSEWKDRPRVALGFDGCPFGWSPEKEWKYKRYWGLIPWTHEVPKFEP